MAPDSKFQANFATVNETDRLESTKPKTYKKLKSKSKVEPNTLDAVATTSEIPQHLDEHRSNQCISRTEDRRRATMEQRLYETRRKILRNASEALGALGEEMIPLTSGETETPSTWKVVAVPATELPVPELTYDLG